MIKILSIQTSVILVLTLLWLALPTYGQKKIESIVECCSGENGRCTGSSSCRVCTDCSRCAHCNSGGSCGVCAGGSARRTYKKNYSGSSSSNGTRYKSDSKPRYTSNPNSTDGSNSFPEYYLKTLLVNAVALNLRNGPGTSHLILERLSSNQELIFLDMIGDWVKVRVKTTGTIGYVYYKYVVVAAE